MKEITKKKPITFDEFMMTFSNIIKSEGQEGAGKRVSELSKKIGPIGMANLTKTIRELVNRVERLRSPDHPNRYFPLGMTLFEIGYDFAIAVKEEEIKELNQTISLLSAE